MSCNTWPNFDAWLQVAWGSGQEFWCNGPGALIVNGGYMGPSSNPPYYLDDFLAFYPKFFGLPTSVTASVINAASPIITVASTDGLFIGQFVRNAALPKGSVIVSVGTGTITINNNAKSSATNTQLQVYEQPPVPLAVLQLYLNLAWNSLVLKRWGASQWPLAMGWFIAHYATLYARSDSTEVMTTFATATHGETPVVQVDTDNTVYALSAPPPGGTLQSLTVNGVFQTPGIDYTLSNNLITFTVSQVNSPSIWATWPVEAQVFTAGAPSGAAIAAQGLAGGIQTSKSVGDVAVAYAVLEALADWAAWNLTSYGQQLATMARVVGGGMFLIW
jgi:hypothetical protein